VSDDYLSRRAAEIKARVPDALVPEPTDEPDALFRLYALLALTTGKETTCENVHDAWCAWMLNRGESHESIVPFSELDRKTKREDQPFVDAIRAVATDD
jgi:hypothetical protein